MTLQHQKYIDHLADLGKTEKYTGQVASILRRFAGDPRKAQARVNQYARQRSDKAVQYAVGILRGFGRWAGDRRLEGLQMPSARTGRTSEPGALEPHEVQALQSDDRVPAWRRTVYMIAATTGLRPGEILRLRPEHVVTRPDGRHELHLPARSQKSRRADVLPCSERVAQVVRESFPARAASSRGEFGPASMWQWQNLAASMRGDLRALGLPMTDYLGRRRTMYSLRGFFASSVLSSGAPIHIAQRLMRHTDPQTTLRWYARPSDDQMHAAMDAVQGVQG
jgi:integrase